MAYAKNRKQAVYRVGLKHQLRREKISGWKNDSSTKKLEKLLFERR